MGRSSGKFPGATEVTSRLFPFYCLEESDTQFFVSIFLLLTIICKFMYIFLFTFFYILKGPVQTPYFSCAESDTLN